LPFVQSRPCYDFAQGLIGQIVDGHEIVRPLGTGGMGEVYLARSKGGMRALKVVRADHKADKQAAARFRREVLALGKLQHPAIVQILDAGRFEDGGLYLAMEYVDGQDLQRAVTDGGALSVSEALTLLARVASALAYAHAQGIVHRDLKPGNVLLEGGDPERAKIIDFGLAKVYATENLTRLTEDQQVLGSPLYWAPEQSSSAAVGPPADVYALGAMAYFALSGQPMFKPRPAVALVYAHVHEVPEALGTRVPGIDPKLAEIVRACVSKAAAARPTAAQLASELEQLAMRTPKVARIARPPKLFAEGGDDASANQIRQIALELAGILECSTEDIDRTQNQLSELELDLAMLDSEVDVAIDPEVEHKHDHVDRQVSALRAHLDDAFRALLDDVLTHRGCAPAEAEALFTELDGLFARYRSR
jgi:serine/threonine protein kinase